MVDRLTLVVRAVITVALEALLAVTNTNKQSYSEI